MLNSKTNLELEKKHHKDVYLKIRQKKMCTYKFISLVETTFTVEKKLEKNLLVLSEKKEKNKVLQHQSLK